MQADTSKKTVLILGMGGTLGMRGTANGPLEPAQVLSDLLTWIPELEDVAVMRNEILCNVDSSQLGPIEWLLLANRIKKAQISEEYAGVVVLHGTDTLAFSASALSFLLPNLTIPVVLTGGQKPLAVTRTDARNNVLGAVETALDAPLPEVIVFFHNVAYRGNRVVKTSIDTFGAFESPNYPALGEAGINWTWHPKRFWPRGRRPTIWPEIPKSLPCSPWVLPWLPGMDFSSLGCALSNQWAVILEAFGTGNMPFNKETQKSLSTYIEGGGMVFVRSQVRRGRTALSTYAPGKLLQQVGFSEGGDMTREAMVTKLMVLKGLGLEREELLQHMSQSLVGEITELAPVAVD